MSSSLADNNVLTPQIHFFNVDGGKVGWQWKRNSLLYQHNNWQFFFLIERAPSSLTKHGPEPGWGNGTEFWWLVRADDTEARLQPKIRQKVSPGDHRMVYMTSLAQNGQKVFCLFVFNRNTVHSITNCTFTFSDADLPSITENFRSMTADLLLFTSCFTSMIARHPINGRRWFTIEERTEMLRRIWKRLGGWVELVLEQRFNRECADWSNVVAPKSAAHSDHTNFSDKCVDCSGPRCWLTFFFSKMLAVNGLRSHKQKERYHLEHSVNKT